MMSNPLVSIISESTFLCSVWIIFTAWGEILKHPENSVTQTIAFRYQEFRYIGIVWEASEKSYSMFLSKYSLDRNNKIASLFRTQLTPDFLVAEDYGLQKHYFLEVLGSRL
jgi:hypothetical protein